MEQVEELTFLLQWFCTFLVGDLYTAKHIVVMSITSPPAGWRGGALILEINVKVQVKAPTYGPIFRQQPEV
jgi:hypothetical protein